MAAEYTASMDMISATQTSEKVMESEESSASSEYSSPSDMETVTSGEEISDDQQGFTPVKSRKRGISVESSQSPVHKVSVSGQNLDLNSGSQNGLTVEPKNGLKVYRIITQDFTSELEVLALLYCRYPKLDCGRKQISNRSVLLTPKSQKVCDLLESLKELNGKKVSFEPMKEKSNVQTGVIHYVPIYVTEEAILNTEKVLSAVRITRWDPTSQQKVETEMIKFTYEGPLPAKLQLGICGKFRVRPFVPSPIRCYKCQHFGHVATTCRSRAPKCRLCAGTHMTEQCQIKRNAGQQLVVKCANCGEAHPASSGLCTKLRDITATKRAQAAQKFKPAPLPPTNAWGKTVGEKTTVNQKLVSNRLPIGLAAPKNVNSGKVRGPITQTHQGPQNPAKRSFSDFFKNPEQSAPVAFRGTPQPKQLATKPLGSSLPPGGAQPPKTVVPTTVQTTVQAVAHKDTPMNPKGQTSNTHTEQKGKQVEAPVAEEEQFIELIINAIDMAKRDLDLIQSMMIRNIKQKNGQIRDYLLKQSEKVTQNLADLRNLM